MPLLFVLLALGTHDPALLTVPLVEATSTPQEIWIDKLAWCESRGDDNAAIIDTNGYWSRGRFQFQLATWLAYGKKYGATRENIFDGELQEKVVREMLDNGGWRHWYNCGKAVRAEIGDYPI